MHVHPVQYTEGDDDRRPKRPRQKGNRQPQGKGSRKKGGKGKGKGKGKHPYRGNDGKYNTDRSGKEICYNFNRHPGGCTTGQCPQGRAHVCEHCLQPHRAIDCSTKKGPEVHT